MSNGMWSDDTTLATVDESAIAVEREHARLTVATPRTAIEAMPEDDSTLGMMIRHAQGIVRDQKTMIAAAKQIGGLLSSNGFYRFPTGGATVQGASIDLAEALAQAWKGMVYRVRVVHTEHLATGGRRIHLRALVVDLHSLVMSEVDQVVTTSPPPGKFGQKEDQAERWHSMSAQAAVSKIVRNVILRVLPSWFVESGLQAAYAQAAHDATAGKSLPEARANALDVLAKRGVTKDEAEKYTGTPVDLWAVPQLQMLGELNRDLARGTVSVEQVRATLAGDPTIAPQANGNGKSALGLGKKKPEVIDAPATT